MCNKHYSNERFRADSQTIAHHVRNSAEEFVETKNYANTIVINHDRVVRYTNGKQVTRLFELIKSRVDFL